MFFKYLCIALICLQLAGCATIAQQGLSAEKRPTELDSYYYYSIGYTSFTEELIEETISYNKIRYKLETALGDIKIDYYKRGHNTEKTIVVFPVLGGSYFFSRHFSRQFARRGFNAALIRRYSAFKKTENFHQLEEILRKNVIRDRISLSFIKKELGAKNLGAFGISRGAINAASTAGVDARLSCNVMALGGSDIPDIYKRTTVGRFQRYRKKVTEQEGITEEEYYQSLQTRIKTDPKYLAQYIDPSKTLLILAMFDSSVPFSNGRKLRRALSYPKTIFLVADHYSSILTIQFLEMLIPWGRFGVVPFDYIESEAMDFYNTCFGESRGTLNTLKLIPIRFLQIPFNVVGNVLDRIF